MDVNQVLEATLSPGKIHNFVTSMRGENGDADSLQTPRPVKMRSNSYHRQLKLTSLVHALPSRAYST
jgi:hypothetical protein